MTEFRDFSVLKKCLGVLREGEKVIVEKSSSSSGRYKERERWFLSKEGPPYSSGTFPEEGAIITPFLRDAFTRITL